jgi:hypothetical protein
MYTAVHVKYPLFLPDLDQTWTFWTGLRKILKHKISWKSVHFEPSCSKRTYRYAEAYVAVSNANLMGSIPLCNWGRYNKTFISPSNTTLYVIFKITSRRLHVSTHQWGHHQASINEQKMSVHEQLCHQDPVWFTCIDNHITMITINNHIFV